MKNRPSYATPAAFRRALTDRLMSLAAGSRWSLSQLQRQIAYDRLLERLYLLDDGWVVKGATALLARELGMRATIDVDVYRLQAPSAGETDLRSAVEQDIGDWFRFEIGPPRAGGEGQPGTRLPVTAYIGATPWARFHVDLVDADLRMTGDPDPVPPLARIDMPGVEQHGYRAYPLADHLVDKVVATMQRYGGRRYRRLGSKILSILWPSSRVRSWTPQRRGVRSCRRPTVEESCSRLVSTSQTVACGRVATPPRPVAQWAGSLRPWTRLSRSSVHALMVCLMAAQRGRGLLRPDGGRADVRTIGGGLARTRVPHDSAVAGISAKSRR